ncbi:4'-phosphopantetheinyl transferase superfamily protein [Brevibacillus sp. HB1.4B]|uniref:4'-phosphopantetheinyl transferase family protein n=1 Tax=Brevibacillus sp. HB1.4B TaxID=2738845 RepID=UPI00156B9DC4|nr:4'-phosphopantetheinyl transferase superfamily protein [Brevibacillus sp. HB1.4B]NRS19704.1 4'-phosphopantetheinyl transferase superfamily protein [Brevibacillus sp. HB1.4B]
MQQVRITHLSERTKSALEESSSWLLAKGEVHIWLTFVQAWVHSMQELEGDLSAEELDKRARFHFHADRERYVVAHGLLRRMIGRYQGIFPRAVQWEYNSNGKPFLCGPNNDSEPLFFNLSHSHELVAVAFSRDRLLGVDVEHLRHIPEMKQLMSYFHPVEREGILRLPSDERQQAFFDCWTRKEAFVKATGEGLSRPLDSFFMEKLDGSFTVNGDGIRSGEWKIHGFTPGRGYAGAVAIGIGRP